MKQYYQQPAQTYLVREQIKQFPEPGASGVAKSTPSHSFMNAPTCDNGIALSSQFISLEFADVLNHKTLN